MQFSSCHSALGKLRGETDFTIALAGNPNVGKSSVFNILTGMGVETANYPGKTVEVNIATTTLDDSRIGIIDLPGTYALGAVSEDQWVARQGVLDGNPDAVMMVVDATNLTRNLYMVLQFLELGYPMVLALNVLDVARREGRDIDIAALSDRLGVPILPTVANRGEGLDELIIAAEEVARGRIMPHPHDLVYGQDVEKDITILTDAIAAAELNDPYNLPHRALALLLLENDPEFIELTSAMPGWQPVLDLAERLRGHIEEEHGQASATRIAAERHALAAIIAEEVETVSTTRKIGLGERLWRYTTRPLTGVPILFLVLGLVFVLMYFVGQRLADFLSGTWGALVAHPLTSLLYDDFGNNVVTNTLLWAVSGMQAALTVGIPYVLVFYLVLAFLEDSGYLNSVAFLTDSVMHKFGLHGRAMIPIIAGAGCNVPAIIGTRVLTTMRERLIAGTLIVMVPCSARSAVIFGAVGFYAGWQAALGIYVIVGVLWVLLGLGLNKVMPGKSAGLVMEMFPFRRPHLGTVFRKTWFRFKAFVFMAVPILLVGSLLLGLLFESGHLFDLASIFSPVVENWMGLPPVAGLVLIMAILRKELALQLLTTMAIIMGASAAVDNNLLLIMDKQQLFVFALVTAIYIPCAATIAALSREMGWVRALVIMAFTVALAVLVGGVVHQIFTVFTG
ncbi:MAG: ferrous iron transport protein B [Actinobacteria bacterium]|nr:ferrous iron transport protein B [Actinomycetota bacterium]MCL5882845.1 ferrous iron transport protein B [Actinomycetota bacterium]